MKLTVVGCSGSFPSPGSACSSYLVEADGFRLLLDMGNGALGELQRHVGLYDLDAIFLSHLHADHCIDMCAYFVVRYYRHDGARPVPLPVYGPEGTEQRLTTAHADTPSEQAMSEVFDFHTLKADSFEIGPFSVVTEKLCHPVDTFGIRIEHGGSTLAYSGDTGTCDALEELARDADLFLCEASFVDGKEDIPDLHLNGREAGEAAARADVRRSSSPTSRRGRTRTATSPTRGRSTRARWNWPCRERCTSSEYGSGSRSGYDGTPAFREGGRGFRVYGCRYRYG